MVHVIKKRIQYPFVLIILQCFAFYFLILGFFFKGEGT